MAIVSCSNGDSSAVRDQARQSLRDIPPGSVAAPITPGATSAGAVATSGVSHYICPNNCEGSGGSAAGACPVCGSEYEHNQAYHDQPGGGLPAITTTPGATTPGAATPGAITPPTTLEPPQNANGVWHYTCTAGCSGGGGSAGKCATCGGDLAHNTAYHN